MNGQSDINQLVLEIRRHIFNLIFFPIEDCQTTAPMPKRLATKRRRRPEGTQVELNDALSNLYKDNHWKIKKICLHFCVSSFIIKGRRGVGWLFSPSWTVTVNRSNWKSSWTGWRSILNTKVGYLSSAMCRQRFWISRFEKNLDRPSTKIWNLSTYYHMNFKQTRGQHRAGHYHPIVVNHLGVLHADIGYFSKSWHFETPRTFQAGYPKMCCLDLSTLSICEEPKRPRHWWKHLMNCWSNIKPNLAVIAIAL